MTTRTVDWHTEERGYSLRDLQPLDLVYFNGEDGLCLTARGS